MGKRNIETEKEIIFDLITDGIIVIKDNQVEFTNSYFNNLTGFVNLAGKTVLHLIECIIPKYDRAKWTNRFKEILDGSALNKDLDVINMVNKNGDEMYVDVVATRFISDDNEHKIVVVIKDISERVRTIEKLNASNEQLEISELRLQEAQKVAQIGSFQGTTDNDELWWSNELYCQFGLDPEKFIPTKDSFTNLLHPDEQEDYNEHLLKSLVTGDYFIREFRGKHSSGEWKEFETTANAIYNDQKEIIGLQGTVQNITERKRNEKNLRISAERFDRWKSSNFIGVLRSAATGNILDANDSLLNMIGYSQQDLVDGKLDWTKLTPPEFSQLDSNAMDEASKTGTWTPFEKEYIHKEGHRVPILIGGSIFKESKDEFIVFIIDLSEQKKNEEILQLATKAAKVGYYDWHLDKENLHWDKKMHEIFGLDEESTVSRLEFFNSALHPDDAEEVRKAFENSIKHEGTVNEFSDTFKILVNSNQVKHIEYNSLHIRNSGGNVYRIIGTCKDITVRKKMEQQLIDTLEDTENQIIKRTSELEISQLKLKQSLMVEKELNEIKSRFVSTASHQFRTPLAVIQASVGLIAMQKDRMDKTLRVSFDRVYSRIHEQIKGMTDLMDDILTIGKINTEKLVIKNEPTDLVVLCKKIAENYNQIQEDQRTLILEVKGTSKPVNLDPDLVEHALSNFVSNAFKYSPNNHSPTLNINFKKSKVEIVITDTGVGIPESEIESLFEPFYRASNVREFAGTGLGTSIAKEYIEKNGGAVSVKSVENQGSAFTVIFEIEAEV